MIARAGGRLVQGLRALFAFATPVDEAAARAALSPALFALFRRMARSEQLHSLRVMRRLQAAGCHDPDLLIAALLHDCGKSRYGMTLLGRTLAVLTRRLLPRRYRAWSQGQPQGWRRPFVITAQHPAWSAEDMLAAGASPRAASLARRHQDPLPEAPRDEADRLLALLQAADDRH